MRSLLSVVTCLAIAAGCGGSEPHPAPAPAASVLLPAPSASASTTAATASDTPDAGAAPVLRSASPELRKYWIFGDRGHVALYGDLTGLMHTELAHALVPTIASMGAGLIDADQSRCVQSAVDSVREVAFGADDDGLLIVRYDEQTFHPSACFTSMGARKIELEGAKEAYTTDGGVFAWVPGILLAGPERAVTAALRGTATPTLWPARLVLAPNEFITWTAQVDRDFRAHGTLLASDERFRLSLHADLPAEIAKEAETELESVRKGGSVRGLQGRDAFLAARLLQSVELTRSGSHIDAAFDLREPPPAQARQLGVAASLAVDGLRKYIARAKGAEARNTLGEIVRDEVSWWESENGTPRTRKKLTSLPAVPRTVPRGVKYASKPADWKPWARIKFTMSDPQLYQYEVVAAKDGESADVIARGDLNGDGKTSLFRQHLRVDRANGSDLVFGSAIEETDPEE